MSLKESNCTVCKEVDNMQMVQCDKCDNWYHFTCVNVGESISEKDFVCGNCLNQIGGLSNARDDHTNVANSVRNSTTSSKRQLLQLERLEEERKLQERRDKEYLDKKYQLLSLYEDEIDAANSEVDPKEKMNAVNDWVNNKIVPTTIQADVLVHREPQSTRNVTFPQNGPSSNDIIRNQQATSSSVYNSSIPNILPSMQPQQYYLPSTVNQMSSLRTSAVNFIPNYNQYNSHHNTTTKLNHDPNYISSIGRPIASATHARNIYNPNTSSTAANIVCSNGPIPAQMSSFALPYEQTPSPAQLSARHAMSKDLPTFNGNPSSWPMFISSFETSTRVCGFSNEENLVRLQRALKGKALDAVKYRLLLPTTVPLVIETLRTLFGRPEIIIHALTQTIRDHPTLKADKFEPLINFALLVQNLCATLEASGLFSHLNNPMLLQEMTEKLPSSIKLSWAMYKRSVPGATLLTFSDCSF